MAKYAYLLDHHTVIFDAIPRVQEIGEYNVRESVHLPNDPGWFTRKTAYQRHHETAKWFDRTIVRTAATSTRKAQAFRASRKKKASVWTNETFNTEIESGPTEESTFSETETEVSTGGPPRNSICDEELYAYDSDDIDSDDDIEVKPEDDKTKTYSQLQLNYKDVYEKMGADRMNAVHRQISTYHMDLAHISMTMLDFKTTTIAMMDSPCLARLDLTEVPMDDAKIAILCDFFTENTNVTDFLLRRTQLNYRQLHRLIDCLRETDHIVYLDLSGNNMRDDCGLLIARYLESSSCLQYLIASKNQFSEVTSKYIGSVIATNPYLKCLDLSWNNMMKKEGPKYFFKGLNKNLYLENLDISWNRIRDEGVKYLKKMLSENQGIRHISLIGMGINAEKLDVIFKGLKSNISLETIKLYHNPILVDDITWFLTAVLELKETALLMIDFTNMMINEPDTQLVEDLRVEKNIDVIYGYTSEPSKTGDAKALMNKLLKAKKRIELEDMRRDLSNLKPQLRDKLATYFLEMDERAVMQGKPASFYMKVIFDGYVSVRAMAIRAMEMEQELSDMTAQLETYVESSATQRIHALPQYDPMDFYFFRNSDLKEENIKQMERQYGSRSRSRKATTVSFSA